MNLTDHLPHPKYCFCDFSIELLRKWFIKRHVEGIPTLELLSQADSESDKEAICVVAMFDIDEQSMLEMMSSIGLPEHHIIPCGESIQKELSILFEKKTATARSC